MSSTAARCWCACARRVRPCRRGLSIGAGWKVLLDAPEEGVAPGQAAVFYDPELERACWAAAGSRRRSGHERPTSNRARADEHERHRGDARDGRGQVSAAEHRGHDGLSSGRGRARLRCVRRRADATRVLNPMGAVHGGWALTLIDSCCGCAGHTTLPAGVGYGTVETKVNFVRPIAPNTGTLRAEGRVLAQGRTIITAEGKLIDKKRQALRARHIHLHDHTTGETSNERRHRHRRHGAHADGRVAGRTVRLRARLSWARSR